MTPVPETAYGHIEIREDSAPTETVAETGATEMAVREYFKDIAVMVSIARCESHFRHTLADGSVLHGERNFADTGVMQINARYHAARARKLGLNLNILGDNMAYARDLYEKQGTAPWKASALCWNRTLAQR